MLIRCRLRPDYLKSRPQWATLGEQGGGIEQRLGRLADLVHREVGIGASEALAAFEAIRISLCLQRVASRKLVFRLGVVRAPRLNWSQIKVSRPLLRRSNLLR